VFSVVSRLTLQLSSDINKTCPPRLEEAARGFLLALALESHTKSCFGSAKVIQRFMSIFREVLLPFRSAEN
jgi:hypothetical protein